MAASKEPLGLPGIMKGDIIKIRSQVSGILAYLDRMEATLQKLIDRQAAPDPPMVNPTGGVIRSDAMGSGAFGTSRVSTKGDSYPHGGVDLTGKPGQDTRTPHDGKVNREGFVYNDDRWWKLVEIENDQYISKLMYCEIDKLTLGQEVKAGDAVGIMQDITRKGTYRDRGMDPHIHWTLIDKATGKKVDPAPFIFPA